MPQEYTPESEAPKGPDHIALATYAQIEVEAQTGAKVKISTKEDDWVINQSGLYYGTKSTMEIDGEPTEVVYHIEFDDDTYGSWKLMWLNRGGEDIVDNL